MIFETILGGVIVLLLLIGVWQRSKIIKELVKVNEVEIIGKPIGKIDADRLTRMVESTQRKDAMKKI